MRLATHFILIAIAVLSSCKEVPIDSMKGAAVATGCGKVPEHVVKRTGIDVKLVSGPLQTIIGEVGVKTNPKVEKLVSEAAQDEELREYLRCLAIHRDGFTHRQYAYLEAMYLLERTKPTPQQFAAWVNENPFPSRDTEVGITISDDVTTKVQKDLEKLEVSKDRHEATLFEDLRPLFVRKEFTSNGQDALADMGNYLYVIINTRFLLEYSVTKFKSSPETRKNLLDVTKKMVLIENLVSESYGPVFSLSTHIAQHINNKAEFLNNLPSIQPMPSNFRSRLQATHIEMLQALRTAGLYDQIVTFDLPPETVEKDTKKKAKGPTVTIGFNNWIGYGPLFVAKEEGYFGDLNVDPRLRATSADWRLEFRKGEIQAFADSLESFLAKGPETLPDTVVIVLGLSQSVGGDGLVTDRSITKLKDLKDKRFAVPNDSAADFFLFNILEKAKLYPSIDSIVREDAPYGAYVLFWEHAVQAAVLWEPYLSSALERRNSEGSRDASILEMTSATDEAPIVDILVVSKDLVINQKDVVKQIVKAWCKAVQFLETLNPEKAADHIISNMGLAATREQTMQMLNKVRFFHHTQNVEFKKNYVNIAMKILARYEKARKFVKSSEPKEVKEIIEKTVDWDFLEACEP